MGSLKQAELFALLCMVFLLALALQPSSADAPTIVVLSEDQTWYRFELGDYRLSQEFLDSLRFSVIPLIDSFSRVNDCNAVDVIGHTDGAVVKRKGASQLDVGLSAFLMEDTSLVYSSNLDLGMLRAISVWRILDAECKDSTCPYLKNITHIAPQSAGQAVRPDGTVDLTGSTSEDFRRRRIEIRLWKREEPAPSQPKVPLAEHVEQLE